MASFIKIGSVLYNTKHISTFECTESGCYMYSSKQPYKYWFRSDPGYDEALRYYYKLQGLAADGVTPGDKELKTD